MRRLWQTWVSKLRKVASKQFRGICTGPGEVFRRFQFALDERLVDHDLGGDICEFTFLPGLDAQIAILVTKSVIKPVVDRIFPFSTCQPAIEYSASGRARKKIVISLID